MVKNFCIFNLLLSVCLFLSSCDSNPYYNPDRLLVLEDVNISDTLVGEKLIPQFGIASKLYYSDSYLIGLTAQSSRFFEICRPESDTCITSFGEYGRTKNDFINAPYELYIKENSGSHELYLADENAHLTKVIDLEKSYFYGKAVVTKTIRRPNQLSGFEYHLIYRNEKDWAYYKELSYKDARDNLYYSPNYAIRKQGEDTEFDIYPSVIPIKDYEVMSMAYAGEFEVSPDLTKCVLVHRFIDIIDIFDIDKEKVIGVMGKDSYGFDLFSSISDVSVLMNRVKAFNINASVTNNYIFQLKSNLSISEILKIEEGDNIPYSSIVVVSNWEGKILHKFIIDNTLRAIAYDEDNKVLYGVDDDGILFKYSIGSYL